MHNSKILCHRYNVCMAQPPLANPYVKEHKANPVRDVLFADLLNAVTVALTVER